jgi:antitoxin component of RelBE/YafQ-DinJ toxin-antitoxin module
MKTKLTLRVEKEIIEKAKEISKEKGYSLSQIVELFLKSLSKEPSSKELTPNVKELKGILKIKITEKDYKKYLEEKYL